MKRTASSLKKLFSAVVDCRRITRISLESGLRRGSVTKNGGDRIRSVSVKPRACKGVMAQRGASASMKGLERGGVPVLNGAPVAALTAGDSVGGAIAASGEKVL